MSSRFIEYGGETCDHEVHDHSMIDVTVIMPTFNEARHIEACLSSVKDGLERYNAEILVIDGFSVDGTRALIKAFIESSDIDVRLINNERRYQVYALNIGLMAARGRYIVRCDAHSIYPPSYFQDLVDFYEMDKNQEYGNVGLPYITEASANSKLELGIPMAMSSRIGVGASHRTALIVNNPYEVDTLLFGAWRRELFGTIGKFDHRFIRGQDYEHNIRIRDNGLKVALIPGEPFRYYTRSSFVKMRKMVYQYAYVKGQLSKIKRKIPNVRSIIPLSFFSVSALLFLISWPLGILIFSLYAACISFAACSHVRGQGLLPSLGMFLAIPQMHVAHALGFLHGLFAKETKQGFIEKTGHTR